MDEKLVMDAVETGVMSPEEYKKFLESVVTYRLDRHRVKTIDNLLDIFEFLTGEMVFEKGEPEKIFLANPVSKYYTKVEYEEEEGDTDESASRV
jgi:hypothetical protein